MKKIDNASHNSRYVKPRMYFVALLINVLVFIFIGYVYTSSNRFYGQKLFDENIHNVENLNTASANAAYTYTCSMGTKLNDAIAYIESQGLSYEETVRYLGYSNTNQDRQFQLVRSGSYGDDGTLSFGDYTGISIRKIKKNDGSLETVEKPIKYESGYYDILSYFTDVNDENFHGVCFAPEFTDPDTKLKCFAVYHHTVLADADGGKSLYTVLLAVNSKTALAAYDVQCEYDGQSSVLVNSDGDYLIKNNDYRNVNFFDYIVNYNGLTLDRKEQIQNDIISKTSDTGASISMFYKNHQGADCVFSLTSIENGWYSITCVPLHSFNLDNNTVDYSLIILILFLFLFVIDGVAIYLIGKDMSYNIGVAEQATAEANKANKAKSRFLSTMSHELRTPLNAIIGLVSLSADSIDDPTVLKDYLKKIDLSSKLLLQLISDILDVSAIESNKMKLSSREFDMTRLISSLSAIYYDQCAAKGIAFNVILKNMHSETLVGDSVRVNQVLLNFLSNAVKFTPNGGKVTLNAEQTEKTDSSVTIKFVVSDTGCGISEEMKLRLFRPFERADGEKSRKYSGTGLGLSIAKNLVELMGGQIGVESTDGVGSSFWAEITFGIPKTTVHKSLSTIKNLRVLAVITDADEREYIEQIFSGFGAEHILTDTAASALEHLREGRDKGKPYSTCILDWKMSDLSGIDATKKIREEFDADKLRLILLTYNIAEASAQCSLTGADTVLGKPIFSSALYNLLEEGASGKLSVVSDIKKSYTLAGKRILLVEDNMLNVEIAQLLLEKIGAQVETAENGQLGCDRFNNSAPKYFDAILMDIQMPVMNGYEAAAAIRTGTHPQAKDIPIIAMTADAFAEDVEKAYSAGMNEHVAKPIVPDNLYSVLTKYICR